MKIHILVGEGIECENESERFFSSRGVLGLETRRLRIQDILQKKPTFVDAGDWVFIPGGFSFADHFGSGKLLAYELRHAGFFADCEARGVHLMGVCNGFQVLTEAGLFGRSVSLKPNKGAQGFVNRWVRLKGEGFARGAYNLPARHGEGRIERASPAWETGVTPFLLYDDPQFDNGSVDRVAGLAARRTKSAVVGLMPHPEIAVRLMDAPDTVAPDWPPGKLAETSGDGVRLMKEVFKWAHGS